MCQFSQEVREILDRDVCAISAASYRSNFRLFSRWCRERRVDPFRCPLGTILSFLSSLVTSGRPIASINAVKSAISYMHDLIDGDTVGHHPLTVSFMAGAARTATRPLPQDELLDIRPVLTFLREQELSSLNLRQLSQRLAFFLGLLGFLRPSCLQRISRRSVQVDTASLSFLVVSPKERRHKRIVIDAFPQDVRLCPLRTMAVFLEASDPLRGTSDALFVTSRQPHTPASSQTISRWLEPLIRLSNPRLSARCLRSVGASTALDNGIPLETVVHVGNWAAPTTFINFYRRQSRLTRARANISTAVLAADPRSFMTP